MHRFVLILAVVMMVGSSQTAAFAQSVLNLSPSRVVGQPNVNFRSSSPNVVEGRELYAPLDVAVDLSSTPRAVYVADFANNRVLGWRDSQNFANGAIADYVLGQLDRVSTIPQGPGTSRSLGFNGPAAVAVDSKGSVYVADAGNNRVLRFPKDQITSAEGAVPDLVIGQPNFSTNTANQGGITDKSLSLAATGRADLIFDARGNLWVTDPGNNRVLRYPAAALDAGENRPSADVVVGQVDFTTGALATEPPNQPQGTPPTITALNKSILRQPYVLAIDTDGRLYVGDTFDRVLVYLPEVTTGRVASRIVGLQIVAQGQQARIDEVVIGRPTGLFTAGNRLGVADAQLNRVILYPPFADWPAESETQVSPAANVVIGQQNFARFEANRNQAEPSGNSLNQPSGLFYTGTELWVTDTANNRVIVLPELTANAVATRVLGQVALNFSAPNITEGKELFLFSGYSTGSNISGAFSDGAGIAIDNNNGGSPRLYISDTFNNRILGYRDARRVRPGDAADIVIGQIDFQRTQINAPFNTAASLTNSGLFRPSGLAVDSRGDLYVADSGNGRVLRFPSPFDNAVPGERMRANLVLGQLNFNSRLTDPTARNMLYPFGLAFTVEGSLVVSDALHSRLLFFRRPVNGDFTNGQAAERVIGQPDFFTVGGSNAARRLNSPRHIAIDTDDRLYVTDAGNNRVQVYDRITSGTNDPEPAFSLTGVASPQGVWVSPFTGEIWVANTRGNQATRFPRFERLPIDTRADYNIPSAAPLALTQDASGNLYIAEGTNRIAMFYNALRFQTAGNYAERALAPGTISILYAAGTGVTFGNANVGFTSVPLPTELNDIQVLLNDQPVPLYYVGGAQGNPQINFLVPMNAPDSGTAEVQVVRKSTGQIIAISNPQFARVSPALFVQGGGITGQLAALNEDNSVNTPATPAAKGSVIQLFGTGQGFIPNAPPDGQPPTGPVETPTKPSVYLGGADLVKPEDVLYSGLAPSLVGVWQINARIPMDAAPGQNEAFVVVNSVPSNRWPTGQRIPTFISVKP